MSKVSLIMPSYGRPQRTERAIRCLINQDTEYEAYVIGDKCPVIQELIDSKKAEAYMAEAKKKNIKLSIFNLPIHYGGYGYQARVTGIKLAYGDYIMFMDNDDVIENNHVSSYYNAIVDTKNELVYFDSWLDPIEGRGTMGMLRSTKMEQGMIGHAEIIVSKQLLLSLHPETAEYGHDWGVINQIVEKGYQFEKSKNKPTYRVMGVGELREAGID
jgi:glycosyltransferase involved in cell wall biosynthesis